MGWRILGCLPDPRDQAYIDAQADPGLKGAIACAIARYRRPDRLRVGDAVPPLELRRLEGTGTVRLDGFWGARPLTLIFGSYT